jgi:hypothetical protein
LQHDQLLIHLLFDKAGCFVGFQLKPSNSDVLVARKSHGTGWACKWSGEASKRVTGKPQSHLSLTPTARQLPRNETLLTAFDKLATSVPALRILFAVVNLTIFLVVGQLHVKSLSTGAIDRWSSQ